MADDAPGDLSDLSQLCDRAIAREDIEIILDLIDKVERIDLSSLQENHRSQLAYILGNLFSSASSVSRENLSEWRVKKFPAYRAEAINCYRIAQVLGERYGGLARLKITTNLANEISYQSRQVEAISMWDTNLSIPGDAPIVASFAKARSLLWLTQFLADPGHADCYALEAYKLLKALDQQMREEEHPTIFKALKNEEMYRNILDFGDQQSKEDLDWDDLGPDQSYSDEEKRYRWWCLELGLFANDLNDITKNWIADRDILQFPSHVLTIENGPYLAAAFSAIKREYCFARFLAYEGINAVHPEYEDQHLFLADTSDGVRFEGYIEKTKTAFRVAFSVLDSIAMLLNQYFDCEDTSVSFRSRWIMKNLASKQNPFIDALYWLACDLTDDTNIPIENWKAPNPNGGEIRRIRNAMEHSWLRVVEYDSGPFEDSNDYAYIVTRDELNHRTVDILRLARAAMHYFCYAVKCEETQKEKSKDEKLRVNVDIPLWRPVNKSLAGTN